MSDTIYAVSSGAPPAAIAVIRVSGPSASLVAQALTGNVPAARRAVLRRLRGADGGTLDHALVLWFPGPASATGEDLLELQVHGGRAVIAAVERAIGAVAETRRAEPGEFTRRALMAGRIDLAQAAGLADLLEAETETQRRAALAMSEGAFSREVRAWMDRLSVIRAQLEAAFDYDDEGDIAVTEATYREELESLMMDLGRQLAAPTSERVREGWRVVIAGPPNAGKSSLFNAMLGREAAIVAPVAGTTRDRIEARVLRDGQTYTLIDTAGLAEWTDDPIEREGIRRSREVIATADLVLWVADVAPPEDARVRLWVRGRCDEPGRDGEGPWDARVSARAAGSVDALWHHVARMLSFAIATTEGYLLHETQQDTLRQAHEQLRSGLQASDQLVSADYLRRGATQLASLLGVDPVEAMLDALFARFCVGK